ncbi:MAG: SpoIIE family protein phosphatase [Clostridia bacterium]|nr:SpoIIE family protein phosphatase [Clostridia bacterium]
MTDEKMKKNLRSQALLRRERERKRAAYMALRRAFLSLCAACAGGLFSGKELPFGVYPLGLALVCSSEKYIAEYMAGIFLRAVLFGSAELYLPAVLCAVCAGARYFFAFAVRKTRGGAPMEKRSYLEFFTLEDELSVRAAVAAFAGVVCALACVTGGGTFYDLFAGVFFALTVLIFTFLFSFAFDTKYKSAGAVSAGRAAFVFCAVLVLTELDILSFSVGIAVAYAVTLAMGFTGDGSRGAVAGLLMGAALGGDAAVILAFSGLAAGVFYDISHMLGAFGAPVVTACAYVYLSGAEELANVLPELIFGAVAAALLTFLGLLPDFCIAEKRVHGDAIMRELLQKKRDTEKYEHASSKVNMLSSLSEAIKSMSESFRRPDKDHLSEMCREVFGRFCADCPKREECRKSFERGLDIVDSVTERLMKSGKLAPEKYSDILCFGCPKKDGIIAEINIRATKMLEQSVRGDKTRIFAFDYSAAARIIADTVAKSDTVYAVDAELTEKLACALSAFGLKAENLLVCGERKKYIIATGRELLRCGASAREIRALCEGVCGGKFTMPEYAMDDTGASMTLESTRLFEVEYAGRQCAKKGEKVCGDAIGITESREEFFYGFICDGMGSGREADITARIGKTFLEKMLSCGNRKSTTLDMLNMFISNKSTECFSTVDLLEIDLLGGKASFTKSGATASYIVRKGSVYKIASDTMPLGIVPEVSAEVTEFSVCDGDLIVMCTDGICTDPESDGDSGGMHLVDFLEHEYMQDVGKIAENIVFDAARTGGRSDDMTVGVFRVRKKGSTNKIA